MTYTDPTDAELNWLFATRVCGWTPDKRDWVGENVGDYTVMSHHFLDDEAVVMKWLNIDSWRCARHISPSVNYFVVTLNDYTSDYPHELDGGEQPTFARAAVIALLRKNGVDIQFSKNPRPTSL